MISPLSSVGKLYRRLTTSHRNPLAGRPQRVSPTAGAGKRALISYLAKPLLRAKGAPTHSNRREVAALVELLTEMGYECWAVDFRSQARIDYSRYALLFGFGLPFERSFETGFNGKRVCLLTGACAHFSDLAERRRIANLFRRSGRLLIPRRTVAVPTYSSIMFADAVFSVGNAWTTSTFADFGRDIRRIPVSYLPTFSRDDVGAAEKSEHKFLWFGSEGAVHKGLDLVLEAMQILGPDFELDVCGPVTREADFCALFAAPLFHSANVRYHGFVDPRSEDMRRIFAGARFMVFPSCSEGGSAAVLTCMHAGLVPVMTRETGVDIEDFGLLIEGDTPEAVVHAMRRASEIGEEALEIMSEKACAFARRFHSLERHIEVLKFALAEALDWAR